MVLSALPPYVNIVTILLHTVLSIYIHIYIYIYMRLCVYTKRLVLLYYQVVQTAEEKTIKESYGIKRRRVRPPVTRNWAYCIR